MTGIVGLMAAALLAGGGVDGKAALERMKSLAGEWRGHVITEDGPPAEVVYSVTAGGSTVQEKLFPGTEHEMVSMYHLDGNDLVLTHYCGMGNQPRMRLVKATGTDPLELPTSPEGLTSILPTTCTCTRAYSGCAARIVSRPNGRFTTRVSRPARTSSSWIA